MVVERAIGIVMSRTDETEAHARPTHRSQHEYVQIIQITRTLVDEAVHHAAPHPRTEDLLETAPARRVAAVSTSPSF